LDFSDQRTDRLLDLIYDAATEQDLWRAVLTEIADLTGSQGGALFGQSIRATTVYFDYNGRLSEECHRAYQERHFDNPLNNGMASQPIGRIVLSDEVIPLSAFRSTPFFEEVFRPQGLAHSAMARLAGTGDFHAAFNICRSPRQGPIEGEGRRILAALVPHLCRSMQIGLRLDAHKAFQRAEHDALDRLSVGVILLDRRARLVYANAAARALDAKAGPLNLRGGAVSVPHARRLAEVIRLALNGAPMGAMSLPRPGDGRLLTVLVSSVRGRDVGRFADMRLADAAVLMFIIDPANRPGLPPALLADAYGLTPAEARVALAMASGLSIPEAAHRLNVSPNTVKTHLRKVFGKTGTSRQAELARLLATVGLVKADDK
jgi:DNA-binding CsgD family transcriptional regulator/PAS domain-containing protein